MENVNLQGKVQQAKCNKAKQEVYYESERFGKFIKSRYHRNRNMRLDYLVSAD